MALKHFNKDFLKIFMGEMNGKKSNTAEKKKWTGTAALHSHLCQPKIKTNHFPPFTLTFVKVDKQAFPFL